MKRRNIVKLCFEFNDFLYSEHFKYLEIAHSSIYNICKSLYLYLRIIVRDVLKNRFKIKSLSYYYKLYSNQNVFFSPTLNNRRAVDDIERLVHDSYHITNIFDSQQYPIFQVYIYSSLYAFSVIRKFLLMKSGVRKNITGNALLNYILAAGFYIVSCKICKYSRIQSLIVSNDHTYFTRAFIKSAQQYHVDSLYAQHASVAEYYPQLSCSYSILDGIDSLKKYVSNGKSLDYTIVLLLGAVRYDYLVAKRKPMTNLMKRTIGIGINALDDFEIIEDLCRRLLLDLCDYRIIIRAHPNWNKPIIQVPNVVWTSALDETINLFFDRIDILISNDSCVHFDAVKYGIPTVMYTLSKDGFSDQYSFVSSGFVKYVADYESLVTYLKKQEYFIPPVDLVRKYDNSYKREYEGCVSHIIASLINSHFDLTSLGQKYNLEKVVMGEASYYQIP